MIHDDDYDDNDFDLMRDEIRDMFRVFRIMVKLMVLTFWFAAVGLMLWFSH